MARSGITVQIDRRRVLHHAAHLQQSHRHHAQVRLHRPSMGQPGSIEYLVDGRLLIGDEPHPGHVQVGQRPGVLEGGAGGGAAHRRGVVAVGVERRVQVDEVDRRGVEAAQDVQVVPGPDRAVGEIGHDAVGSPAQGSALCAHVLQGRLYSIKRQLIKTETLI